MTGEAHAVTKYILFTNGDITFSPLYPILNKIVKNSLSMEGPTGDGENIDEDDTDAGIRNRLRRDPGNFVLTGQRIDIRLQKVLQRISFINNVNDILQLAKVDGELHGQNAIDYFIYPKSLSFSSKMPPFLLGKQRMRLKKQKLD
jgi:hypothetical protein